MSDTHPEGCTCGHACQQAGAHDDGEQGLTRRQMLRSLGALGAGITLGPTLAMGAVGDRRDELVKSRAVLQDKANKFTILHTSDIHAQLHTHDEFFFENGKAVYRKRGGFAVLKTMID